MVLRVGSFPTMIMEIASGDDGKDEFKMMLQAGALTRVRRLLHQLHQDDNFVVVGIYISHTFRVTRRLFCLSDSQQDDVRLLLPSVVCSRN